MLPPALVCEPLTQPLLLRVLAAKPHLSDSLSLEGFFYIGRVSPPASHIQAHTIKYIAVILLYPTLPKSYELNTSYLCSPF